LKSRVDSIVEYLDADREKSAKGEITDYKTTDDQIDRFYSYIHVETYIYWNFQKKKKHILCHRLHFISPMMETLIKKHQSLMFLK